MNFLFRSAFAGSLPIARRVMAEGHKVLMWIERPKFRHVGDGLIDKTNDISAVKWADIIVFDGHGHGLSDEAELWRKTKPVMGSSKLADRLEHDRRFGIEIAKKAGMKIPYYRDFKGKNAFVKAERFLTEYDEDDTGWVLKPSVDGIRTHVARDTEEMVRMLKYFVHAFEEEKAVPDFVIERKIKGIEVSTEGWWNGREFFCFNGTIEENRFSEYDLGEQVGCAGDVVWIYPDRNWPLVQKQVLPIGQFLGDNYRGPIDVNNIVTGKDEFWFLEFTPRFGISAVFAFLELVDDAALLLSQIAKGETVTVDLRKDNFGRYR